MPQISYNKVKYATNIPTTIIVNGLDRMGYELAKTLTEQGGFVIILDDLNRLEEDEVFLQLRNVAFLDYTSIADLIGEIRRLDYVYYLNHNRVRDEHNFSSQDFLVYSGYLNQVLNLASEFDALFLLTTSLLDHRIVLETTDRLLDGDVEVANDYSRLDYIKYAENLVLDYTKSRNLDAKIMRMGVLLGEYIEIDDETSLARLLWFAARGEDLLLQSDGLMQEFYVHLNDAVFGAIKLQFSRELERRIYTCAYNEPFTQLGLAYKLQEVSTDAGEIKFSSAEDAEINIRPIYKAAANLSMIGWHPKVEIHHALIETLGYFKRILEVDLNNALNMSRGEALDSIEAESINATSALGKLIAERKATSSIGKLKQKQALKELQLKERPVSAFGRFRREFEKWIVRQKNKTEFLRNLTLTEATLYISLISLAIAVYVIVISPTLIASKNLLFFSFNSTQSIAALDDSDWELLDQHSSAAIYEAREFTETTNNVETFLRAIGLQGFHSNLKGAAQTLLTTATTYNEYAKSVSLLGQHAAQNKVSLQLTPTASSLLSVNNPISVESQETLEAATENYLGQAQTKLQTALNSQNLAVRSRASQLSHPTPDFVTNFVLATNMVSGLDRMDAALMESQNALGFASLLSQSNFNLGLIIRDSSRINYAGGEFVGLGSFEYTRGQITRADFFSANSLSANLNQLEPSVLQETQQIANNSQIASNANYNVFMQNVVSENNKEFLYDSLISNATSRANGSTIEIDQIAFQDFLQEFGQVTINERVITADNYTAQINVLQSDAAQGRTHIQANLAAVLWSKFLQADVPELEKYKFLQRLANTNRLNLYGEIKNIFVPDQNEQVAAAEFYFRRLQSSDIQNLPQLDINTLTNITNTGINNSATINFSNYANVSGLLICVNSASTLQLPEFPIERIRTLNLASKNCAEMDIRGTGELRFVYETSPLRTTYLGGFSAHPNTLLRYYNNFRTSGSLSLGQSEPRLNSGSDSLFYSGEVYNQFRYKLNINRNE